MDELLKIKIASLFKGLDILARAQYVEGVAGIQPANAALRSFRSPKAQLKFIKDTLLSLHEERRIEGGAPNPAWWADGEVGFYRPIYKTVATRLRGMGEEASADDVMAEEFAAPGGSTFYSAGRMARTKLDGILNGSLSPKDLTGLPIKLSINSMTDYARTVSNRRRLEREQAQSIQETTSGVGGGDFSEWEAVIDGITAQPDHPISREFFVWLKERFGGAGGSEGRLMNAYLDMVLTGKYKNEAEIARAMGLPSQAFLNKTIKKFTERAADELSSNKGNVRRIKDLLSDASFLNQLLRGRVPGSRTAALIRSKMQKVLAQRQASSFRLLSASDYMAELEKASKFEKGVPADPTENMSEEDAAEWERQNEEHADQFKTAAAWKEKENQLGRRWMMDGKGETIDAAHIVERSGPGIPLYVLQFLMKDGSSLKDRATYKKLSDAQKAALKWLKSDEQGAGLIFQNFSKLAASDKTAASGLYGFTKAAEKSCTGAATRLAKYAAKLAKEIYTKDADTAPFMEEHAKRGSKVAKMLRQEMSNVGPGAAPKTAAAKSGMGLYGFKDKTAKLAMDACSELQMEAGRQAAGLAAKFGEKQDGAGFLKKHAKATKCAFSDLILDSYPTSVRLSEKKASFNPTVEEILAWDRAVSSRMAASFLASDEMADDEILMEGDELMAGRTWGGPGYRPKPVDDSIPYNKHPESPPAGANGSAERRRYNRWFRENVCPDHATNCGL